MMADGWRSPPYDDNLGSVNRSTRG